MPPPHSAVSAGECGARRLRGGDTLGHAVHLVSAHVWSSQSSRLCWEVTRGEDLIGAQSCHPDLCFVLSRGEGGSKKSSEPPSPPADPITPSADRLSCRPDHTLRGSPAKGPTHSPPPPRDGRPKSARVLSTCRLSARLPLSCDAHLAAGTDGSSTSFSASATGGDQSWARIAGGRACPEPGRQGAPHVAPGASTSTDAPGKAPRAAALSGSQSEGLDVAPPNTTNCGDCRLRFSARRCATRRRRRQKSAIIAAKKAKARNAPRSMSALHPQRGVNSNLPVSSGAAFENAYQLLRGRISTVTRTHINSSLDRRAHRIETSHCRRRCFPWHLRHHPLPSGGAAFASRRFS